MKLPKGHPRRLQRIVVLPGALHQADVLAAPGLVLACILNAFDIRPPHSSRDSFIDDDVFRDYNACSGLGDVYKRVLDLCPAWISAWPRSLPGRDSRGQEL